MSRKIFINATFYVMMLKFALYNFMHSPILSWVWGILEVTIYYF